MTQSHAYKGYANTFINAEIFNSFNPKLELKHTVSAIGNKLKDLFTELKGFIFVTKLVLEFKKIESDNETKYRTFYLNSKAEAIMNESYIDYVFESIFSTIVSNIQKSLEKGSGWITDTVVNHTINISKYNLLSGRSYIKLPKELDHKKKRFD